MVKPSIHRVTGATRPAFGRLLLLWAATLAMGALVAAGRRAGAQPSPWSALNEGLQGDRVALIETLGNPTQAPRTALIVTEESGLLRSTDGGQTWQPVPLPAGAKGAPTIQVFAPDPADANGQRAYAGIAEAPAVLLTKDAGATWEALEAPPGMTQVDHLVVLADGRVVAGSVNLPYVFMTSDDQGKSWDVHPLLDLDISGSLTALARNADGSRLYMRAGATLHGSDDGGKTWKSLLGPDTGGLPTSAAVVSETAGLGPRIFAVVTLLEGEGKVTRVEASDDGGFNWKPRPLPPGIAPVVLLAALVGSDERLFLLTADGGVQRSADAGESWTPVHQATVDATGLRVDAADGGVWVATRGAGVFRFGRETLHGGAHLLRMTAVLAAPGPDGVILALARVREALRDRSGHTVVEALYQPYHRSGNEPWAPVGPPLPLDDPILGAPDLASSHLIYSGSYRSTDWGRTWTPFSDSPDEESPPHIAALGPITGTERTLYALDVPYRQGTGGSRIVRSPDGGATWVRMAPTVSGIVAMAAPDDPIFHTVFAVSERGVILRSYDHEPFMEIAQIPASPPLRNVFGLAVSSRYLTDHTLMVSVEEQRATDRALTYISTDEGETWRPKRSGLAGTARPRALFFSPDFWLDRTAFLGGRRTLADDPIGTVYRTNSAGDLWTAELTLPAGAELQGFSLAGTMQAGKLYAAAGDAGIWQRTMNDAVRPTPTVTPTRFFPTATPVPPGFTPSVTPPPTHTASPSPNPTATGATLTPSPTRLVSATPSPTLQPGQTPPTSAPSPTVGQTPTPGSAAIFLPMVRKNSR